MGDLDDIRYDLGIPQEWSEEMLDKLIAEKIDDYHWENVAPLIQQLEELGQKPRKANDYVYRPNTRGKYPMDRYRRFFTSLGLQLFQKEFITKDSVKVFVSAFDGVGLPEYPEGYNRVEWLKEKNLCTHLVDELIDRKIITDHKRDKNTEVIFGIKNVAQTRQSYHRRDNMKPKNHKDIDDILDIADKSSKEEYKFLPDK